MSFNLFLIIAITVVGALVVRSNRPIIVAMVLAYWGMEVFLYFFDSMLSDKGFYRSLVIADFIVYVAAMIFMNLKDKFAVFVAIISICFMVSHGYGYYLTTSYQPIYPYDYALSVLYCILLYTILTEGGALNVISGIFERARVSRLPIFGAYRCDSDHQRITAKNKNKGHKVC